MPNTETTQPQRCGDCQLPIEWIGGEWVVMGTGTTADGLGHCPPDPDADDVGEHQPAAR